MNSEETKITVFQILLKTYGHHIINRIIKSSLHQFKETSDFLEDTFQKRLTLSERRP